MTTEEKISEIANRAINAGLSKSTTIQMLRHSYTDPELFEDAEFVQKNLYQIILLAEMIYKMVKK